MYLLVKDKFDSLKIYSMFYFSLKLVLEKDISTVRPKYRMMAETTTESNPSGDINS